MVYKVPEVSKVPGAQNPWFPIAERGFLYEERITLDRKSHLKGAPGGRSRREERIRGRECSYHADLRHVRNTGVYPNYRGGARSPVSGAGAYFLTEREASLVAGANPGGLQKLDLDERNASVAQNAAVTQI